MSRLDLLRMKRAAASYGQPLTMLEQIELDRLEADREDRRHGKGRETLTGEALSRAPVATLLYEV